MNGIICDIKKFAVHDGDGIRTTVFFKGCPLKCKWCHNPESISFKKEAGYISKKCINCGECLSFCVASSMENDKHTFDHKKCIGCGKCEDGCLGGALKFYGKEYDAETLSEILAEDKDFYDQSGGGITLSGGECLMQADFCQELLERVKEKGIHTAVDTCGYVSRDAIDKVIPYTDIFLYDIKAYDDETHVYATTKSNKIILENIKYIDGLGKNIEVRIPIVPSVNDDQIEKVGRFLKDIKNLTKVRILPYHNFAGSKYEAVDMENTMGEILPPSQAMVDMAKDILKKMDIPVAED